MSRAESKARTRQLLLDAAREVFAERGFNAATVEQIVERAGFTRGAFYANWPDKTELMWEIAAAESAASFDGMATTLEGTPLEEKLEALQSWFNGLMEPRPLHRAFNELWLLADETPEGRKRKAEAFAAERRAIVRVLDHIEDVLGVELPMSKDHFAAMGFAVGNGLGMQHVVDPDAVPVTLFGDAQAYLWFGVLAAAESRDFSPRTQKPKPGRRQPGGTRS